MIRQRVTPRQQRNKTLLGRLFPQSRQSSQEIQQITVNIKPISLSSINYRHSRSTCLSSLRSLFYHNFYLLTSCGRSWRIQSICNVTYLVAFKYHLSPIHIFNFNCGKPCFFNSVIIPYTIKICLLKCICHISV